MSEKNTFDEFISVIENMTGFSLNPTNKADQLIFYGTSDKFEEFKEIAGRSFDTGTVAYLMDTKESKMYSNYKNAWY